MSAPVTRWGIIGTGRIAGVFAEGLRELPDAQLAAVGSRAQQTADTFGDKYGAARRYASYEQVANDPEVDAVYVATPHSGHAEASIMCLRAGKAVLCEKPFTINARQAEEVVAVARREGVFLMEAMWTRFLPLLGRIRELLAAGAIGEPRMVTSDFGFRTGVNPKHRLFDPALGGGALLDVGVYPVSLASMVFGEPERVSGLADIGETGVDEQSAAVLGYGGGRLAVIWTAVRTSTPHETTILGTDGWLRIHSPSWRPTRLSVVRQGKDEELVEEPFPGNGYQFEAAEVQRCLRAGKTESDVMPLDETLAIMRTLDRIRDEWGLRYPME